MRIEVGNNYDILLNYKQIKYDGNWPPSWCPLKEEERFGSCHACSHCRGDDFPHFKFVDETGEKQIIFCTYPDILIFDKR